MCLYATDGGTSGIIDRVFLFEDCIIYVANVCGSIGGDVRARARPEPGSLGADEDIFAE